MANVLKDNPLTNFSRGFLYPFRAARLIKNQPRLFKFIFVPFTINLGIFCLAVYLGFHFFQNVVTGFIPQGEAWYWIFLTYFLWMVAVVVTSVLVFFSFSVVGNLLASPFNDILSEKTEELLGGRINDEPFNFRAFLQDSRRTLAIESKKIFLFVSGMLLLFLLNVVPVIGSLLYSVLSVLWTIFFLVVEYTGFVFARKRLSFQDQRRFIFGRTFLMTGFGTGVLCILAIPFLQFLCIPLGVVGATMLCHDNAGDLPAIHDR